MFDQAISVAPLTLPAHTSLFTGRFPPGHGVRDNVSPPARQDSGDARLDSCASRALSVPEHSQVRSCLDGTVASPRVSSTTRTPNVRLAAATGPRGLQRRADNVVADAIDWLDAVAGSRFLLWAHSTSPHRPYRIRPNRPGRNTLTRILVRLRSSTPRSAGCSRRSTDAGGSPARSWSVAGDPASALGDHGERELTGVFVYDAILQYWHHRWPAPRTGTGGEHGTTGRCDAHGEEYRPGRSADTSDGWGQPRRDLNARRTARARSRCLCLESF